MEERLAQRAGARRRRSPGARWLPRAAAAVVAAAVLGLLAGGLDPEASATSGVITTFAGGGEFGDGGPATAAPISPVGLALDPSGALSEADTARVREISPGADGVVGGPADVAPTADDLITSVAGNGTPGAYAGDGGPALSAALGYPQAIAADAAGDFYVSDTQNDRIRFVCRQASCTTAAGTITLGTIVTVAGTGQAGFNGDGAAVASELNLPQGIALDGAGNLFIADTRNHRVRELCLAASCPTYTGHNLSAGQLVTVAGTGSFGSSGDGGPASAATLYIPEGVAVDSSENVYVATEDQEIRRIAAVTSDGTITTVAASPTCSIICNPAALSLGPGPGGASSLYVASPIRADVARLDLTSLALTVFAGTPGQPGFFGDGAAATAAQLNSPSGLAVSPAGGVFIADLGNHRIRKVDPSGAITTVAGPGDTKPTIGDGAPASQAVLSLAGGDPVGLAARGAGLYISDPGHALVRTVDSGGTISTTAGIYSIPSANGYTGDGGPATASQLNSPQGVLVDPAGNVYIADTGNGLVRRVARDGTITTVAGVVGGGRALAGYNGDGAATATRLLGPTGLAVDSAGNLYIADTQNGLVRRLSPGADGVIGGPADTDDVITTIAGNQNLGLGYSGDGGPATQAQLFLPDAVAVAADGSVYIADSSNDAIRRVGPGGVITTVAGTPRSGGYSGDGAAATGARLTAPEGIAVDSGGNLYIADTGNSAVRFVCVLSSCTTPLATLAQGEIVTLVGDGSGTAGFLGDGAGAAQARLARPSGVAVGPSGTLYIADAGNDRVRAVAAPVSYVAPPPATPAPSPSGSATPSPAPMPGSGADGGAGGAGAASDLGTAAAGAPYAVGGPLALGLHPGPVGALTPAGPGGLTPGPLPPPGAPRPRVSPQPAASPTPVAGASQPAPPTIGQSGATGLAPPAWLVGLLAGLGGTAVGAAGVWLRRRGTAPAPPPDAQPAGPAMRRR